MTKILIEVKGGNIQWISSTKEILYNIIDYDNAECKGSDAITDEFCYSDCILSEEEMYKYIISQSLNYLEDEEKSI